MNNLPQDIPPGEYSRPHEIYFPGHARAKLLFIVLGFVLLGLSFDKFGPALNLAFTGGRARGEAVQIVRTGSNGAPSIHTTDAEVLASVKACEEAHDRESVYWVEYVFTTAEAQRIQVRSPLGQHLKPLQPLRDRDGFPSTISIWYGKNDPTHILLPFQFGTWFLPGMLAFLGILTVFMGSLLLWHANQPVEMPDLTQSHAEKDDLQDTRD